VTPDIDLGSGGGAGEAGREPGGGGEAPDGAHLAHLLELSIQEAVYRAALADRGLLVHPALLDFLR
jgi:hypothetical protein